MNEGLTVRWTYIAVIALAMYGMSAYCQEVTVESSVVHEGKQITVSIHGAVSDEAAPSRPEEEEPAESDEVDTLDAETEQMEGDLNEEAEAPDREIERGIVAALETEEDSFADGWWERRAELEERFGDRWEDRQESVAIGANQKIPYDKAVTDLVTIMGNTELDGYAVDVVTVLGNIMLGEEAVVDGDIVCILGNIVLEDGATVNGDVVAVLGTVDDRGDGVRDSVVSIPGAVAAPFALLAASVAGHTFAIVLLIGLLRLFAALLLGYLAIALMPNAMARISDQVGRNPFISGLVGAGALVATPLLFFLLLITCIGILLVPLAAFVCLFFGKVAVSIKIGTKLRTSLWGNSYRPYLDLTVGLALLTLISFVPLLGSLTRLVLIMAGLGALVLTRFGVREGIGLTPAPVVVPSPVEPVDVTGQDE